VSTRETTGAAPASESSKRLADVAIIIPHYNHAEFIGEAVASALAQEPGPPRVVVVDDGSTDPDVEAALDALPDEVTVIRQENAGVSAARNTGAAATTEPYLIFLDSDDRMPPDAAGRLLDALEADPESAYAYGKMRYFGAWSGEVDFPAFDPYKMLYRSIVGWLGLIRRTALDDVGGFDPSVLGFEDWDLMLAFLEHGYGAARVEEVVLEYRKHHETSSLEAHRSNYHGFYRQLRRRHPDLYSRADELAGGSDLTARGRMIYRTWWAWRPLPARLERALYGLRFNAREDADGAPRQAPAPDGNRSIAGGALLAAIARVSFVLGGAIVTILVARLLGPSGSGAYLVISSLLFTLLTLLTLGIEFGASWLLVKRRWSLPVALASLALAAVVLGTTGAGIGMLLHTVANQAFAGVDTEVALVAMAALPPALLVQYFIQVAIAAQRYEAALTIGVTAALAYVIAVAVLGAVYDLDGAVAGLLTGQLCGAVIALIWWWRRTGPFESVSRSGLREALSFGIKLYAANAAAIVIYRFDVFLLNGFAGSREAGYYAVAIALTNALVVLPTALGNVLFPRLAELTQEPADEPRGREVQDQAIRHTVLIVAVTSVTLAIGMPLLIVPVFGAEFEPAIEPALILLPGAAALGLATTLYSALAGRGRPDYPLKIALLVTPLAIGLYFLLIPPLESDGAALGSLIAYLISAALAGLALRRVSGPGPGPGIRALMPGRSELRDYRDLAGLVLARIYR
jgi:O-antigen/teichoic acid export membrane protein/glycosyltransferase involved in cell wall biosynthesis